MPGPTTYTLYIIAASPETGRTENVTGFSTTTFLVTRLEEYRTNTFNLSASTIKGTAVYQHVLPSASTNAAAPGPVMNLTVARPDGPIFTTVRVTWELPSILQRNSEIVKFMLSHNATGGNLNYQYPPEEINVNINIKTVTRNLEVIPENTYYIEVYAIGTDSTLRQYIGQKSTKIYIAPAGAPDPPEVLTCKASTDTTITLTWAAPHQRNDDPIQYYVVNSVTTGVMFSTTSNMTEYTVDYGLQPATAYVFSVASVNEAVKSVNQRTYSSQIGCTTKATTTENEASSLFIPGVVMMIAAVFTILLGAGLWIAFRRKYIFLNVTATKK
ncbi:receptor-type tyrosine-protein phosphatase H-like [Argopecten irradians]|uniref:receptor-type tyrosine-protein phosphatase H-like n=1 Tax=Argopecten irradians TaxID=31199 RepID=UPI00371E4EFF